MAQAFIYILFLLRVAHTHLELLHQIHGQQQHKQIEFSTANSSNNGLVDDFNVGFIAFAGDGISVGLGVNSGLSGVGGYGATMSGNNSSAELAFGSEL
jgi:hypothetical protein